MPRVKSEGIVHGGRWVVDDETYGVSYCGFSFGEDRFNEGPWPDALYRNSGTFWSPGWIRKIDDSTDIDCMACIAAGGAVRSRHATRGRVIIDGITHRIHAVNSAGVGGTACGATFSQRPNAARRNLAFGQRTNHEAVVSCMACIAEGPGESAEQRPCPPSPRWSKDGTPWWLLSDKTARKLR